MQITRIATQCRGIADAFKCPGVSRRYFVQVVRPAAASRSVNQQGISSEHGGNTNRSIYTALALFYVFISNNKARTGEKRERRAFSLDARMRKKRRCEKLF